MTARASRLAALATLVVLACASPASAQTPAADAERMFREGQRLMEEKRYPEACPKFEAAYKYDGALGTLINLAFCHKEQGTVWLAWLEFREAEVMAIEKGLPDRQAFARARLVELEKSLRKVVIENPRKVPLKAVLVEDRKVPEAENLAVFAVEPGSRKFTFRAKGKLPQTTLVNVERGARVLKVRVPDMADSTAEDLPPPPPPVATTEPPKPEAPSRPKAPPPQPVDTTQRTIGWVGVAAGSAGLVLGGVTGAISLLGPCGHASCTAEQRNGASATAAISTVSFIAGGALVVTGVVLLLTAPSGGPSTSSARDRYRGFPFAMAF